MNKKYILLILSLFVLGCSNSEKKEDAPKEKVKIEEGQEVKSTDTPDNRERLLELGREKQMKEELINNPELQEEYLKKVEDKKWLKEKDGATYGEQMRHELQEIDYKLRQIEDNRDAYVSNKERLEATLANYEELEKKLK